MKKKINFLFLFSVYLLLNCCNSFQSKYSVEVVERPTDPLVSYVNNNTAFQQIFNPTWMEPQPSNGYRSGLLMRTQNCSAQVGGSCVFCGGSSEKASVLTLAEFYSDGTINYVDSSSIVFGPSDSTDSWGTEDPRMKYNEQDGQYYMFYTAYNGTDIYLNLATTPNPTDPNKWTHHGPVFPNSKGSKSGALLLRPSPPHYLLWGDSSIRIAESNDPTYWPDEGEIFLEVRSDNFDSKLVESGPPPIQLSSGDYIFFYNSATTGWPDDPNSAYHPGWVILDGTNPKNIIQRSEDPLMSPKYSWELGVSPYTCNVPNVVFVEGAHKLTSSKFTIIDNEKKVEVTEELIEIYFGGADAVIGSAIVSVTFN